MSWGRKTVELFLLVVFLSFCISVISFEEERKITVVGKLPRGFRGSFRGSSGGGRGGGSSAGSAGSGGGSHPQKSGNGRTRSGTITPAVVAGSAASAHARSDERKKNVAAAIGHAQPTYISLATAILCVTILLFV